jgi:phenol hydroxylase P1 protein
MRKLAEQTLVTPDWFELFIAQNLVLDGLTYPLVYQHFEAALTAGGGSAFAMLTEFMTQWYEEHVRWVDQILKRTAAESESNAAQLREWIAPWQSAVHAALAPVAQEALGPKGGAALEAAMEALGARLAKAGLSAGDRPQ